MIQDCLKQIMLLVSEGLNFFNIIIIFIVIV